MATAAPFNMSRIGRHGLIYGAGVLLSKAVAFFMLPVYTHYLTPADYGVLQLIDMVLEVASIVAGSRLAAGIFRFYHKAETDEERQAVLSTAMVVLLVSYGLASTAVYTFAPRIAAVALGRGADPTLVRIAGISLLFESMLLVPFSYLRVRDQSVFYVVVTSMKLLLQVGLNVAFVVFLGLGAAGVLVSTLIANILTGLFLTVYVVKDVGVKVSIDAGRDLLRFGIPFVGTQVATFLLTFGDRFFLQQAADTAAVGLYGLAYQFGFLLAGLGEMPFSMVWEPARFEIAKRPDRDELYARAFVYFNMLLLTMGVVITLFAGDFLRIAAAPAFQPARDLVPIIVIAYVLQSWTLMHNVGIQVRERTELYTLATWLGAIVALAGYAVLIPRLLGLGAALATVASFGVREWVTYVVSQRLWPVRYRWGPVLRLLFLATSVCVIGVLLPQPNVWVSLATRGLLLVAYLGGVWYAGVLSPADRMAVRQFVASRAHLLIALRRRAQPESLAE